MDVGYTLCKKPGLPDGENITDYSKSLNTKI